MKKIRLDTDYIYDFELVGLISSVKSYKLAWEISLRLGKKLVKKPDLVIEFSEANKSRYAHFASESTLHKIRLFKNQPYKPYEGGVVRNYLVPEYPYVDYVFMSQGTNRPDIRWFEKYLHDITPIEMLVFIPLDVLKSKKFFIF